MPADGTLRFDLVEAAAAEHVSAAGIALVRRAMPLDVPAEFDGLSITLNTDHCVEWRAHYLVHSFASVGAWCLDLDGVAAMYRELREAKAARDAGTERLERAITRFRQFEEAASSFSVWLLDHIGTRWAIQPFTVFFRADLEAMTRYHRDGRAPQWPGFLARWQADVARGERPLEPFRPVPLPPFRPAAFERQQVKQERESD